MKTFFVATLITLLGAVAFADSLHPDTNKMRLRSTFQEVVTDDFAKLEGGTVDLVFEKGQDISEGRIRLVIARGYHCPDGVYCPLYMPAPLIVDLPIVSVSYNYCGAKVYTAAVDMMPVDGDKKVVRVADNTHNMCKHMFSPITVEYEQSYYDQINGVLVEKRAIAHGTELQVVFGEVLPL